MDDECRYEGNINQAWGNSTAEEMVRRFWEGICAGGYVGHGETYLHPKEILWWSKGGSLHGDSAPRIQFLKDVVEDGPHGLTPSDLSGFSAVAGVEGEYYLAYTGNSQSASKDLELPEDGVFEIDVIDTWEMTVDSMAGTFTGICSVTLPGKPYIAMRIRRV